MTGFETVVRAGAPSDSLPSEVARAQVLAGLFGDRQRGGRLGRYRLTTLVGEGAHGQVFKAHDPKLGRPVAVKVLGTGDGVRPGLRTRQIDEARALARLSHPNVVQVFDVGIDPARDAVFIVMEFVDGLDLARWLARGPRPWPETLAVFTAAGRGLAAAHRHGLVHRDFKPANVLLDDGGAVKVVDFGLAADGPRSESDTAPHPSDGERTRVVGTPIYMAPEQHAGHRVDARADQFAFAVALWTALVGRPPYGGATAQALAIAKADGPPPIPADATAARPVFVALRRAMSPDPARRFDDMDRLLAALSTTRPRVAGRMLAATAIGAVTVAAIAWPTADAPCPGPEPTARWGPADEAAITRSFTATGLSEAQTIAARVGSVLDDYAGHWTEAAQAVCTLPSSGDRSEATACLSRAASEFETTVHSLRAANVTVVGRAWALATGLPTVDDCLDPDRRAAPSTHDDPQVDAVMRELSSIQALARAGDHERALRRAEVAWADAEHLDAWTRAAAGFRLGRMQVLTGDEQQARHTLRAAYFDADEVGAAWWSNQAASALATVHLELGALDQAEHWLRVAHAALERAGDMPQARMVWLGTAAQIAAERGRYREAIAHYTQAIGLLDGFDATDQHAGLLTSRGLVRSRIGDLDAAADDLERAIAIREAAMGPDHPRLFGPLLNLGTVLVSKGDTVRAKAALQRALGLAGDGPSVSKAGVLEALGNLALEDGDEEAGADYHLRALAMRTEQRGPDHRSVGLSHLNLGNAYLTAGRPEAAAEHHREALRILEPAYGAKHPHLAYVWTAIGSGDRDRGALKASESALRTALEIRQRDDVPAQLRGETRRELALTLAAAGAPASQVETMASRSIADYQAAGPRFASEVEDMRALIAEHGAKGGT